MSDAAIGGQVTVRYTRGARCGRPCRREHLVGRIVVPAAPA